MVTELFYLVRYAASFALAPFISASQLRQKALGKGRKAIGSFFACGKWATSQWVPLEIRGPHAALSVVCLIILYKGVHMQSVDIRIAQNGTHICLVQGKTHGNWEKTNVYRQICVHASVTSS